jgi:phospholipid transport system substrate-binding protein
MAPLYRLAATRRAFLALSLILPLSAGAAEAATPFEQFVTDNAQKGLALLNNKSVPQDTRINQFSQLLVNLTDVPRIADFTLGQYRRTATPAQLDQFAAAFQNYALAVYRTNLQAFLRDYNGGWTLTVTGSQARTPTDVVVETVLNNSGAGSDKRFPVHVSFRVDDEGGGKLKVIDYAVEGLFLALEQRDDFVARLGQNNGDIGALIADMNAKAQSMGK